MPKRPEEGESSSGMETYPCKLSSICVDRRFVDILDHEPGKRKNFLVVSKSSSNEADTVLEDQSDGQHSDRKQGKVKKERKKSKRPTHHNHDSLYRAVLPWVTCVISPKRWKRKPHGRS